MGDKIYALIKSLCQPGSPGDKKFGELVELVQEHFTPKQSEYRAEIQALHAHEAGRRNRTPVCRCTEKSEQALQFWNDSEHHDEGSASCGDDRRKDSAETAARSWIDF